MGDVVAAAADRKEGDNGYTCPCGEWHPFPAYVYAHWGITLNHECEACGRKHRLNGGRILSTIEPRKPRPPG